MRIYFFKSFFFSINIVNGDSADCAVSIVNLNNFNSF